MKRVNLTAIVLIIMGLIAGYCFGGKIGLGIAAILFALFQLIPDRR